MNVVMGHLLVHQGLYVEMKQAITHVIVVKDIIQKMMEVAHSFVLVSFLSTHNVHMILKYQKNNKLSIATLEFDIVHHSRE